MQELNGFIKLYRKLKRWGWYKDTAVKCVFLHFLLSASYTEFEWMGQVFKPGQLITSISNLSEELGFSQKQIRTAIDKLCSTKEVGKQTTNKYTIITVMNWESYQTDEALKGRQTGSQRANGGQADCVNNLLTSSENHEKRANKTANKKTAKSLVNSELAETTDTERAGTWANEGQTKGKQRANEGQQYKNIKKEKNIKNSVSDGAGAAPQLSEILVFISENRLRVDGRKFYQRYSENGWKTEGGKRITDWRRMLKVWDRHERENKPAYADGYAGVKSLAED